MNRIHLGARSAPAGCADPRLGPACCWPAARSSSRCSACSLRTRSTADRLDHAVDSPDHQLARGPSRPRGSGLPPRARSFPAVALSVVIVVACLLTGRLNGAVLAAAAVPAVVGAERRPAASLWFTAPTWASSPIRADTPQPCSRLPRRSRSSSSRPRRGRIGRGRCGSLIPAAAVRAGMRGRRRRHRPAMALLHRYRGRRRLGIGTVCGLALLLDLPTWSAPAILPTLAFPLAAKALGPG